MAKQVDYCIDYQGKSFTCRGILDQDNRWEWDSLNVGADPDDWLKFYADNSEFLLLTLAAICERRAAADRFSADADRADFMRAAA